MTSEAEIEETVTHHPGNLTSVEYVDSSTIPTADSPLRTPDIMASKSEETSSSQMSPTDQKEQHVEVREVENVAEVQVATSAAPSGDSTNAPEEIGEAASVVSMPAAVPSTAADKIAVASGSSLQIPQDTDTVTVASAPAVVLDVPGEPGLVELDDIMGSPHGKNAIVERSPGGRYLRFMEKLGSGASKDVYRAYDTQEGIEVAWNVVHLAGVPKNDRNRIVNEVRLLERLHHHNIISFHGSWVNREKQQVNFVTEILSSGTLQSFINKVQVIRWKIAKRWALQILKGLEYLHSQDPPVIHRDLKCQNIFINGTSGDLRIGDLGLSTVHRNGKALSVLGTPEFMAPDMYEESAYDEKVDIYAFGMCLLEIFTKEIPYRECNNPAQIYKKVIRGDPPDCLRRLKSRHAREFIDLCLGTKDENGRYVRPSATELIAHPFLQLRPSDDDEVEVDPPLQEKIIKEASESSSGGGIKTALSQASKSSEVVNATVSSSPMNKPQYQSTNSLEGDESDRFDEMPDSETGFRKPKVLMGRGQELERGNDASVPVIEGQETGVKEDGQGQSQVHTQVSMVPSENPIVPTLLSSQHVVPEPHHAPTPSQSPAPTFHFLVAAAVIEDEFSTSRPYDDDVLKLVVTLPVEGQTQNVQFDFHLVEDDPIQVAKEMVAELGIPHAAVLEISETISGLARAARIKQDKYTARINNKPMHHRSRSASQTAMSQSQGPDVILPQHKTVGHGPNTMHSQSHPPIPDYMIAPPVPSPHIGQPLQQHQSLSSQDLPPHLLGQQVSMAQMQSQQYSAGDTSLNSQLQSQSVQSQPLSQQLNQVDTGTSHPGHNQQQNWSHPGGKSGDVSQNTVQQNYGHPSQAPLVRSMSGTTHSEVSAPAPAYTQVSQPQESQSSLQPHTQNMDGQSGYGQVPVHHVHVSNQPHIQNGGQQSMMQQTQPSNHPQNSDGPTGYNHVPLQHVQGLSQHQSQSQSGTQQNISGQNVYGQSPMHHVQVSNQQQTQNALHQGSIQLTQSSNPQNADGQTIFGQVPMHQVHMSNQQQSYIDGQQSMMQSSQSSNQQQSHADDGQNVYGQGLMQPTQQTQPGSQHLIMQQTQVSDQPQKSDLQNFYNQVPMQQVQAPNQQHQQQTHLGGQQGMMQQPQVSIQPQTVDSQSIYHHATPLQVQVSNQQQSQNDDSQSLYSEVATQQVSGQQGMMQYMQAQNQQQNGEGQTVYNQAPMHQIQAAIQRPQVSNQAQPQGGDGQNFYGQTVIHQGQVPNQQNVQSSELHHAQVSSQLQSQNADRQNIYGQVPMQQGQASNHMSVQSGGQQVLMQQVPVTIQQQQHSGGHQSFDGNSGYTHSVQPGQASNTQHAQVGQQGFIPHSHITNQQQNIDSQSSYGQTPGQHTQVQNQHIGQGGGQQTSDGQGAYSQGVMQHPHPTLSGTQQGVENQAQPTVSFMSPTQSHSMQSQQQAAQNAAQVYVQQTHQQVPSSSQGQGNNNILPTNFQTSAFVDPQAQSQFMQGAYPGSQLYLEPQSSNQEMRLIPQTVQNPNFGQGIVVQQQQQQQHQSQSLSSQNPQGSGQAFQQQPQNHGPPNQQPAMQSQAGPQLVSQVSANTGIQQNPSLISMDVNLDAGASVPAHLIPARPAVIDEIMPIDSSRKLTKQSSSLSDDAESKDNQMNGVHVVPSIDIEDDMLDDELLAAELRKLDEDFQRNMMRAQKVFDTRMDTLQRTQVQREALHQKTLEKHEKERADFEKRRQQEEIEQNRRIEQLQKDWARRREAMRQKQLAEAQAAETALSSDST